VRRPAFSVLVIPYALDAFAEVAYALRRARDGDDWWHAPTDWGERAESPHDAARRVVGAKTASSLLALDSRAMVAGTGSAAPCELPEYAFGACLDPGTLPVPGDHEQLWVSYEVASGLLRRRAERDAIWELRHRLGVAPACR
jgi:hypothetical protein